jgi:hypothetical protein
MCAYFLAFTYVGIGVLYFTAGVLMFVLANQH